MKKHTIITDWLYQYGDPKIDKKVQKYLELKQENTEPLNQNRMTPKEKAKELIDKYQFVYIQNYTSMFEVKECALIAVDEILNNDGFTKFDIYLTEYWEEVRQEILTFKSE